MENGGSDRPVNQAVLSSHKLSVASTWGLAYLGLARGACGPQPVQPVLPTVRINAKRSSTRYQRQIFRAAEGGTFFLEGGGKSWVASNGASAVMTGKRTTTSILHMYKYIDCMPRSH